MGQRKPSAHEKVQYVESSRTCSLGLARKRSANLLFFLMNFSLFSISITWLARLLLGLMTRLNQQWGIAGVLLLLEIPGEFSNG